METNTRGSGSKAFEAALAAVRAIIPLARERSAQAEAAGRLDPEVVDALHAAGLLRMLVPAELGGGGLTIPESMQVVEELAWADPATSWNLSVAVQGWVYAHFLEREAFDEMLADPRAWVAGSLAPSLIRAVPVPGGAVFRGRAIYGSGCLHANYLVARGVVERDGKLSFIDGAAELLAAIFPIERATVLDTWRTTGMRATGSNDSVFEDVFVKEAWTFRGVDPVARRDLGPISRIPLGVQLGACLAPSAVGAARRAIDETIDLVRTKVTGGTRLHLAGSGQVQATLGEAEGLWQAARAVLLDSAEVSWQRGVAKIPFDLEARKRSRLGAVMAARLARQAVELLNEVAGMHGITSGHPIERCWRDITTISQHLMLQPARFEVAGRIALGQESESTVV